MAKKNIFTASVLSSGLDEEIGVMSDSSNGTGQPSTERLALLKKLMNEPANTSKTADINDINEIQIEKFFPAGTEMTISRDKLVPAPNEWNFFGKPSFEQYGLIVQSIYRYGLWHPVTVWEQSDGKYMILGGHTRNAAYKDLYELTGDIKYQSISCKVYKLDQLNSTDARRIVILSNIAQRAKENSKLRIQCYAEMAKLEKERAFYSGERFDIHSAVAKMFGVSRRQVFMYLSLVNLYPKLLDELEHKNILLGVAVALSKLPLGLQKYIYQKGYFIDCNTAKCKELKGLETIEEIEKVFNSIEGHAKYQITGTANIQKPEGFKTLPLFVKKEDVGSFKEFLKKAINTEAGESISKDTKATILKLLAD